MIKELACEIITEVGGDKDNDFEDYKESPKTNESFFAVVVSIYTNHATY